MSNLNNNEIILGLIYLGNVYIKIGNKKDTHFKCFGFEASKRGKNFRYFPDDKTCYWWDLISIDKEDKQMAESAIFFKTKYEVLQHKDAFKHWSKIHEQNEIKILYNESMKSLVAASLLGASTIIPTGHAEMVTKGFRNNNPGNIELSTDKWQGMIGDDGRFIRFDTMENGIRAIAKILKNYQLKYGINTIEGIITRWAPPKENPTEKYITFICKKTNIPRNRKLDLTKDEDSLYKIIDAIIHFENGKPVDGKTIVKGIRKS